MKDEQLDNLLRDWSNARLPSDEKRGKILRSVLENSGNNTALPPSAVWRLPSSYVAAISGIVAVAAMFLFLLTPLLQEMSVNVPLTKFDEPEKIRVSLIVLKQLPDSDSAVEFLEDTVMVAEEKTLHEIELGGHRLFLWIYPLEKTLFSLDVGLDNAAETGIVAVPDRPQALHLTSNGDKFDVFVSVLPNS